MLETLDQSFGQLMQKLRDLKLEQNTLVIFFSDNGQLGPKEGAPLRGSKGDLYEGGIRMPLILRWPTVIQPNTTCEEVVISNDFFPTFTELAKARSSSGVDGISLVSLFRRPDKKLNRESIFWHFPHYHGSGLGPQGAIRHGNYKLIEWFEKSAFNKTGAFELYDLEKDPGERQNLASDKLKIANQLKQELQDWRSRVNAQLMTKAQ
jgi:arylsulfatase A